MNAADHLAAVAATYFEPLFPGRPQVPETHGAAMLRWLAEPEHRDALVAWLVEAGVLCHAGVWERPEVDEEALEKAEAQYYEGNDERLAAEAAGSPWTDEQWQALMVETAPFFDGRRIQNGPRVYFDDEEHPPGAVPLYRIGGDHG